MVMNMVNAVPYLLVPNGKEAIELYKKIFGAKLIDHMPLTPEVGAQFGMPADYDYANSTMHAVIEIGGAEIYLTDINMGATFEAPGNVEVVLNLDSKKQIDDFYKKNRDAGGKPVMPLEKTFWGAWYTRLIGPLGIGWQLNFMGEQPPAQAKPVKAKKQAKAKKKKKSKAKKIKKKSKKKK